MRPPNIFLLLLTALTTAGALRVIMNTSPLSVLRDEDVIIPCDILEMNVANPIAVLWKRLQNGTDQIVFEYIDGKVKAYRAGSYMEDSEIRRGNAALHIPRTQFSDEGEYTCRVINTPNVAEERSTLQVSVPPSSEVTPAHPVIELGMEKTVMCNVYRFYPKDISVKWVKYQHDSSHCESLEIWSCMKSFLLNPDGTYNVTNKLTLNPNKEDDGSIYSCVITHRSLQTDLSRNITLTVTEREDNTGDVITAIILTLLSAIILGVLILLYFKYVKKNPPTLSDITGNNDLIDMNRATLTCQIMDFRPDDIEISVCLRRSGKEMETLYVWRYGGQLSPFMLRRSDGGRDDVVVHVDEQMALVNGSVGHADKPLQLEMDPCITKKGLSIFSIQCSLHITPSYELDNGAELSLYVKHPALGAPKSVSRTLHIIGGPPKLLSVMGPERVLHDEQLTLSCPINWFKPKALSVTWLRKKKDLREMELITWDSGNLTKHTEGYSHSIKEIEHEDKSYSLISALTMRPRVTTEDRAIYICRTFHPATNHQEEKEMTIRMTAVPVLEFIQRDQDSVCVGENLKLSCRIHSFYPPAIQVTWYMGGVIFQPITTTDPLLENEDGLYHVTSSSSYTPLMEDLGKEIQCEVQHESLSKPKHITWTIQNLISPPTVGNIQSNPELPEPGKPVTFSCSISNMYPQDHIIQWQCSTRKTCDGNTDIQKDPGSETFSGTTKLTIIPRRDEHYAEISLDITHCGRHITRKRILLLKDYLSLSDITCDPPIAEYGKPMILHCDVTGWDPADMPKVTWSQDGEMRERRDNGGVLSCYLTITPTAKDYGRVYICSAAQKSMRPITKDRCLILPERAPTLSEVIVRSGSLTANQEASFQVMISGFSPRDLHIKWYKEFSTFPSSNVTTMDPEIRSDSLYTCSTTVTFTPQTSDDQQSIRCEVTHNPSRTVREKRFILNLTGGAGRVQKKDEGGPEKKFHIREITERPPVGEEVTLVAYIEECQADRAEFSWYNGMFYVDGEIDNQQDGANCTSTMTFRRESVTDGTIRLEVTYNYQTVEKSYTLRPI